MSCSDTPWGGVLVPCPHCAETGLQNGRDCPACEGVGFIPAEAAVPPGRIMVLTPKRTRA